MCQLRVLWMVFGALTVPWTAAQAQNKSSPDGKLSAGQMAKAAEQARVTDSATALLAFPAWTERVDAQGNASSPPPSFNQRLAVAGEQLQADVSAAAVEALQTLIGGDGSGTPVESVIGSATWTRVTNTKATPYKSVCRLRMKFGSNYYVGTASFVAPRVLLTNAHILWDSTEGGWASEITVTPGQDGLGSTPPFGSQKASRWFVPSEWTTGKENNRDYDIGWIILPDRTLYNKVGYYFGYATRTDSALAAMDLNISGYPAIKQGQQWREFGTKDQVVYPAQFRHYLDTEGGSSGSPMYQLTSGNRFILGVNCAHVGTSYNIATRMTTRYFNSTKSYADLYK